VTRQAAPERHLTKVGDYLCSIARRNERPHGAQMRSPERRSRETPLADRLPALKRSLHRSRPLADRQALNLLMSRQPQPPLPNRSRRSTTPRRCSSPSARGCLRFSPSQPTRPHPRAIHPRRPARRRPRSASRSQQSTSCDPIAATRGAHMFCSPALQRMTRSMRAYSASAVRPAEV
jgi:hypothetical protein